MRLFITSKKFLLAAVTALFFLLFNPGHSDAQMRQVYLDNIAPDNEIFKLSFYSPSEGYVGFSDWVGYTTDSGRTFTKKFITLANVNFNGYGVNVTFGFGINGVKAFNQNTIVVYGHYGLVPAILYSSNGGNNFTLVYHSQFNPLELRTGITDMVFPQNNATGFAVDADRILKTTDGGLNWTVSRTDAGSYFTYLEAVDNNNVFALCTNNSPNKLLKTTNGGSSWQVVPFPAIPTGRMNYAHFLTASTGWLSLDDDSGREYFYKTTNGGANWTLQNNLVATPFSCGKMKFTDVNTGYALYGQNTVWKTFNGGATWEPLPRDNNFVYLGYSHNDLQCWSASQLWAGGGHGLLELSTNGGGTPIPQAYFLIDTVGLGATGNVNLVNYSRTGYTYQWLVDGNVVGTSYNAVYTHDIYSTRDTVKLIVSNGTTTDTTTQYQDFYPPVVVSSFTPTSAGTGTQVMITGLNFTGANSVSFGGVPASGFTVLSSTSIRAFVGAGASGAVRVATPTVQGSLGGFTYIPPPVITGFNPATAAAGVTVTITGSNFTGATNVSFGGVSANTFNVVSSTTIIVLTPSGGSGSVSVTTPGGTGSLAGFISLPTITSFTPLNGTQGTVLNILGTSFTGTTAVSIGGINALSFTVNSSTSITAIVGTGGTGSVTVTKPGGISSLAGFTWFPPPTITSFAPASGPVGTTVTITGTGFHANPTNNIVYFGTVKATVSSGTTTSLMVTVPVGAMFQPISVTSNNLIGYSKEPYLVTFPAGGSITANSFPVRTEISAGTGYYPGNLALGDVDGDGKLDLALTNYGPFVINNAVSILRNNSSGSTVSFEPKIDFNVREPQSVAFGDLDGDGKLDFAVTNDDLPGSLNVNVFRNTSTIGNISFASPLILATLGRPDGVVITDIDGDGKPDIATATTNGLNVYRNISEPGMLAFAPRVTFSFGGVSLVAGDVDKDGKPDMVSVIWNTNYINLLRNISTKGNIAFEANINLSANAPYYANVGDIDGDSKPDLVATNITSSKTEVFRNVSIPQGMSFALPVQFDVGYTPTGIALNDLDGDGKLDIAVAEVDHNFSVLKNISQPGAITLAPRVDYSPGQFPGRNNMAIGDINGDGKPDPVVLSQGEGKVLIFINNVVPEPFIASFSPNVATAGSQVTITGNNFTNVTAVSFGGVAAASFTVNSSTSITAIVGTGASGNVSVTNNYGTGIRPGFTYGLPPVITSISPAAATLGSTVTIAGTNFSAATNNIVYFGGVKASLSSQSTASLTAVLPPGTTARPVTVTSNGLTAYSARPYITTFPGAGTVFYPNSFGDRLDRSTGAFATPGDIDGDGKLDLVISRVGTIAIARNTTSGSVLSFAANVSFTAGPGSVHNALGDLDGDGKLDVAAINYDANSISVFRNTSTIGNLSLAPKIDYTLGIDTDPSDIAIGDLDLDGKPDIIVSNYGVHTVSVFRNLSTGGNLLFDTRIDYFVDGYPTGVTVGDLDGDGKPEIAASVNGSDVASVFRNTSIIGTISFAAKIDFAAGDWPNHVQLGDLDGDGKMEMVVVNGNSSNMSVFRNTSTAGNVSFAARNDFTTGYSPGGIGIDDLDGDGKPDIATFNRSSENVSVFKNICTTGTIALNERVDYAMPGAAFAGATGDMDNDGKPDIVASISGGTNSILRNLVGSPVSIQVCPNSSTTLTSNVTGTSYQWQQNTGTGFTNISDNTSFSGTTTVNLQINNIPVSWNGYQYRCTVNGSQYSSVFTLVVSGTVVTPSVSITANPGNSICTGTNVTFTATPTNGGTPSYQWKRNGNNVGTNSNTYSNNALANGDVITVAMTSSIACASPATVTSAGITMSVVSTITPSVSIIANPGNTICAGTNVTFTATPTNGGTPSYQWKRNGNNVGTNSNTYSNNALVTGDIVTVVMASSIGCASPTTATAAGITMTVASTITPSVTITANPSNSVCAGTNVTFTATPTNGGTPSYQWKRNGNNVGTNSNTYSNNALVTGDIVTVIMASSIICSSPSTATATGITMTVAASVTPSITISGTTTVNSGTPVVLSSAIVNGGSSPAYQWQDSTSLHSWQNISGNVGANSTYTPALTGNRIRCVLTSNANCATLNTVTSNVLVFTVNNVTAVNPVAGNTYGIKAYPNPVSMLLVIDSLKLSDQWQTLEITGIDGRRKIFLEKINGQTRLFVNVEKLAAGYYVAILTKKQGVKVWLAFIKQ